MSYRWYLGSFTNGLITRTDPLPTVRGADQVTLDVLDGDTSDVIIALNGLSMSERNSWKTLFRPVEKFMALIDDEAEWDDPNAILTAGFINKIANPIDGKLKIQIAPVTEYLAARLVIDAWNRTVENPAETVTFEASTWTGVMSDVIARCFSDAGIPGGSPRPPQILGTLPDGGGTGKTKAVKLTDTRTYLDVLREIKEQDCAKGIEWKFKPRWGSSTRVQVLWDVIIGTEAVPHIGADVEYNMILADNEHKISTYSTTIDSNDLYSKIYIQSKRGSEEEGSGADLRGVSISESNFPILLEKFYNPGVELETSQLNEQLNAYIAYAGLTQDEIGFTVAEHSDPTLWIDRLGGMLQIQGVQNTKSAGHSVLVRIVGISFTPNTGLVEIDVMRPQPTYPKLPNPRNAVGDIVGAGGYNSPSLNYGDFGNAGGGGETPPWNPGSGNGEDGGTTIDWGSGGAPDDGSAPAWSSDTNPSGYEVSGSAALPLNVRDVDFYCQNEGNVIFGVGRIAVQTVSYVPSNYQPTEPPPSTPRGEDFGEIPLASMYISNGQLLQESIVKRIHVNSAITSGLLSAANFSSPSGIAPGGTGYVWRVGSISLQVTGILSIAGHITISAYLSVAWVGYNPTTNSIYRYDGVSYGATVFLTSTYVTYQQINNFGADLGTKFSSSIEMITRAGTWQVISHSNTGGTISYSAANFVSGGASLNTWWGYPQVESSSSRDAKIAKSPDGSSNALYNSTSWIKLKAFPVPQDGAVWNRIDTSSVGAVAIAGVVNGRVFFIRATGTYTVKLYSIDTSGRIVEITKPDQTLPQGYSFGWGSDKVFSYGEHMIQIVKNYAGIVYNVIRVRKI